MKRSDSRKLEELSFEEALETLEQIVESLEAGNLPLEEAVSTFEKGMTLRKICEGRLKEVERKIEVLMKDAQDHLLTAPLDDDEGGEEPEG